MTFKGDDTGDTTFVSEVEPPEAQRRRDALLAQPAVVRGQARAVVARDFHYDTGDEVVGQSRNVRPEAIQTVMVEQEQGYTGTLRERLLAAEQSHGERIGIGRVTPGMLRLRERRVNRTLEILAKFLDDAANAVDPEGSSRLDPASAQFLAQLVREQIEWPELEASQAALESQPQPWLYR